MEKLTDSTLGFMDFQESTESHGVAEGTITPRNLSVRLSYIGTFFYDPSSIQPLRRESGAVCTAIGMVKAKGPTWLVALAPLGTTSGLERCIAHPACGYSILVAFSRLIWC